MKVDIAPSPTSESDSSEESVSGYLVDVYCWKAKWGFASQPLDTYPEKHTVHCLYDPQVCRDSGYVVLQNRKMAHLLWHMR